MSPESFFVARLFAVLAAVCVVAAAVTSAFYSWHVVVAWLLCAALLALVARVELHDVRERRAMRHRTRPALNTTVRVLKRPTADELEHDWSRLPW